MAQNHARLPMKMHIKSRPPALNVRILRVVLATDTFFSFEKETKWFYLCLVFGEDVYLYWDIWMGNGQSHGWNIASKISLDKWQLHLGCFWILPKWNFPKWSKPFFECTILKTSSLDAAISISIMLKGESKWWSLCPILSWIEWIDPLICGTFVLNM